MLSWEKRRSGVAVKNSAAACRVATERRAAVCGPCHVALRAGPLLTDAVRTGETVAGKGVRASGHVAAATQPLVSAASPRACRERRDRSAAALSLKAAAQLTGSVSPAVLSQPGPVLMPPAGCGCGAIPQRPVWRLRLMCSSTPQRRQHAAADPKTLPVSDFSMSRLAC